MSDDDQGSYGLVVAFPDGSASFVHGFQAGQIWEAMSRSDPTIERTLTPENEEVVRRMAHASGYMVDWREIVGSGWATVILTKARRAPEVRPIAQGRFKVIDGDQSTGER